MHELSRLGDVKPSGECKFLWISYMGAYKLNKETVWKFTIESEVLNGKSSLLLSISEFQHNIRVNLDMLGKNSTHIRIQHE